MSDPERLFNSGAADPAVRELVTSLRQLGPNQNAALNSWGVMAAKVAALPSIVPPPGASLAPAASKGAALSVLGTAGGKVAALVTTAALLGGGAYFYHAKTRTPAHITTPASVATAVSPPNVAALVPIALTETPAQPAPAASALAGAAPAPTFSGTPLSRLDAEASLVAAVRRQLQSGKPRAALATLSQLQSQFPKGELRPERDVLTVEALAASGNTAAAKTKARAFISAHPTSPLNAKLERVIEAQ